MKSDDYAEAPRTRKAANKFIAAVDNALDAFESLKKARVELSKAVSAPPLKIKKDKQDV